jgi:predicted RNase H-like nuclease (RuvC/YqgF family)
MISLIYRLIFVIWNFITAQEERIAEFKARIAKEKKENKDDYETMLVELEKKNSELKKKLAEFKDDGHYKWVSFKTEFDPDLSLPKKI